MDKYYKNFVLCGEINYYCLLCQETYDNIEHVEKHIRWEKHRKNKKLQEYLSKFKKDFIYKINECYYCEVCNVTVKSVPEHIALDYHKVQKNNPDKISKKPSFVEKDASGGVKIKNNIVTLLQWHGIHDGKCSMCSISVKRIYNHLNSSDHMINLIQSMTKCKDGNCYRELNSGDFYCFTCFMTFEIKCLSTHWIDNHSIDSKTKNDVEKLNLKSDPNNNIDDSVIKTLAKIYSKYFKIDDEKKTAYCLDCDVSVKVNFDSLHEHMSINHSNSYGAEQYYYKDHGKQRLDLAKYGKQNYIKLNEGGSKAFCSLCNIQISAHMKCAKEHVEGRYHRGLLEIKGLVMDSKHEKLSCKLSNSKAFIDVIFGPFGIAEYSVIVINNGICVELSSFALICMVKDFDRLKHKCMVCDTILESNELQNHIENRVHNQRAMQCKVVCLEDKDDEFIRKVQPNLYHCGYCNKVFPFWENMAIHLKNFKHSVLKTKSKVLSAISAKLYLNPYLDVEDLEEYETLRNIAGFE